MALGTKSGEHRVSDTFILAMRDEIDKALAPTNTRLDELSASVNARLAQGDTEIALLKQEQASQQVRCLQHRDPKTDRFSRKLNPWVATALTTAVQTGAAAFVAWVLLGGLAKGVHP